MKGLTKALLSLWLRTPAEAAHTKLLFWPENQASCLPDVNGNARSMIQPIHPLQNADHVGGRILPTIVSFGQKLVKTDLLKAISQ